MRPQSRQDVISDAVRELLGRSSAFRSLPPERQREVASSTVAVASAMAETESAFMQEVDFPAFVRDVIHGTFNAIVDASIAQIEAYAELVAAVARSVDRFLEEPSTAPSTASERDRFLGRWEGTGGPPPPAATGPCRLQWRPRHAPPRDPTRAPPGLSSKLGRPGVTQSWGWRVESGA